MRKPLRQIRNWIVGLRDAWKQLTAFYRAVFGILVAILMVWGVREQVLDRMQAELAKLNADLSQAGAPLVVPSPDEDNEVQENRQILENLERALAEAQTEEFRVAQERNPLHSSQKNDAITLVGGMLSDAGLRVVEISEREQSDSTPLPVSDHQFNLTGGFRSVYLFFQKIRRFPYPCRIYGVSLALGDEETNARPAGWSPALTLTFQMRLYYYDRLATD